MAKTTKCVQNKRETAVYLQLISSIKLFLLCNFHIQFAE